MFSLNNMTDFFSKNEPGVMPEQVENYKVHQVGRVCQSNTMIFAYQYVPIRYNGYHIRKS